MSEEITNNNVDIPESLDVWFKLIGSKRKTYGPKQPIQIRSMIFINLDYLILKKEKNYY
jgi:hypothetical protein